MYEPGRPDCPFGPNSWEYQAPEVTIAEGEDDTKMLDVTSLL